MVKARKNQHFGKWQQELGTKQEVLDLKITAKTDEV